MRVPWFQPDILRVKEGVGSLEVLNLFLPVIAYRGEHKLLLVGLSFVDPGCFLVSQDSVQSFLPVPLAECFEHNLVVEHSHSCIVVVACISFNPVGSHLFLIDTEFIDSRTLEV